MPNQTMPACLQSRALPRLAMPGLFWSGVVWHGLVKSDIRMYVVWPGLVRSAPASMWRGSYGVLVGWKVIGRSMGSLEGATET